MNSVPYFQPLATPDFLKIYGSLGLASSTRKLGGAFRLWTLARALDDGSGVIDKAHLDEAIENLEVSTSTYYRWLNDALDCGMFRIWGTRISYLSLRKISELLNTNPGRAAKVPSVTFFTSGWKAWMWGAFLAGNINPERPISRKRLKEITGVPESTQRSYDHDLKSKLWKEQQFSIWKPEGAPEAWRNYFREHEDHPGAFTAGESVGWPLPNRYKVNLERYPKGQSRKIKVRRPVENGATGTTRLFFDTWKDVEKHGKRVGTLDLPAEIYSRRVGVTWNAHVNYH